MAPTKSRQRQFADLQERLVKDIDPENEALPPSDDESADSDVEKAETKAATDHYVSVGKSKLRAGKTSTASLGPQYRGAKVSRADLEATSEDEDDNFEDAREELASGDSSASGDDVFDDPETADLEADHDGRDVEIDSDDAFGESDEERFKDYTFRGSSKVLPGGRGKRIPRATAADFLGSDEDEVGSEDGEGEGEGSEDEEGESLGSEEEDSDDEMIDEQRMGLIDDEAEESDEEEEEEDGDLDGFIVDSDEDEEDEDEDGESSGQDNSDDEDDEMNDKADHKSSRKTAGGRDDMASLIATGSKSVTSSLSDGQQKDVAKGTAIRQQRKAFDALLNVRIRLQKSLVAINTLPLAADASTEDDPPYEAAEAAALKLWNAIDSFRSNLPSSGPSKKRKRSAVATAETTSQQIWESIEAAEQRAAPRRRAVLQNWSQKANNIRTVDRSSARNKFSAGPAEKTLVGRLDEEMENPERLVKRTRTPRSCAPAQVARKVNEDAHIYDDADFYQLLLKDLVDQRTADTSVGGGAGAAAAATVRFAAVKEAKAKKHVDTKASKGRKMRFNVHDKLQNFMAPEDRRSWEQSAIDRLFGTLFGQKMALNEDDVSEDEEMDGGVDAEEAGLRLFRS